MLGAMEETPQVQLSNRRVVAVDGGTATGKGRLIEELSQLLRLKGVPVMHLSTGSIFRAVACVALDDARGRIKGKSLKSPEEVTAEALKLIRGYDAERLLSLSRARSLEMHGGMVWLDGAPMNVEEQLKGPGAGTGSSIVSIPIPVRHLMEAIVRRQINEFDGYVLIDGRDITNGVVPDAPLRILMTVAPHIAAQRSREHTLEEIIARDESDHAKRYGALRRPDDPGEGVIVLATDDHTPESVRDHVYALMRRTFPELPEL
jgi:cytidylate kinase